MHELFSLDPDKQFCVLDNYLQTSKSKRIHPVERNGLCILQSVKEALQAHGITRNIEELKILLRNELDANSADYNDFSVANVDLTVEVDKFFKDPIRFYINPTVDLFLPALAKSLHMRGTVYQINYAGSISHEYIEATNDYDIECYFAKTSILHVDPVLDVPDIKNEFEAISTDELRCSLCKRSFGGPTRYKRHVVQCTAPSTEEDVKPLLPTSVSTNVQFLCYK